MCIFSPHYHLAVCLKGLFPSVATWDLFSWRCWIKLGELEKPVVVCHCSPNYITHLAGLSNISYESNHITTGHMLLLVIHILGTWGRLMKSIYSMSSQPLGQSTQQHLLSS